jgi:DNA repair protein RecN (Recombination protein N)
VIVITHSPQISAQGDIHYFVYKETDSKRTFTRVKALEGELRTQAIATMLSSDPPTPAALANAKELLHHEN